MRCSRRRLCPIGQLNLVGCLDPHRGVAVDAPAVDEGAPPTRASSVALIPWRARSQGPGHEAGGLVRASPGQGDACPAVAVVVDARYARMQGLTLQPNLGTARTG